jgi:hypothetical protein
MAWRRFAPGYSPNRNFGFVVGKVLTEPDNVEPVLGSLSSYPLFPILAIWDHSIIYVVQYEVKYWACM